MQKGLIVLTRLLLSGADLIFFVDMGAMPRDYGGVTYVSGDEE
jgi:hypothetical protein